MTLSASGVWWVGESESDSGRFWLNKNDNTPFKKKKLLRKHPSLILSDTSNNNMGQSLAKTIARNDITTHFAACYWQQK